MSTYSADRHQQFADLPDLGDELAAYNVDNYKNRKGRRRRKGGSVRPRTIVIAVIVVLVIALIAYGVAFAMSAREAKNDANLLMTQGRTLASQLKTGDMAGAQTTAADFTATAHKLDDNVGGLLWAPATLIPVYGEDVTEVRALANTVSELSAQVLMPVVEALPAGGMSQIFSDGGFNPETIMAICDPLEDSAATINQCTMEIENLGEPHLEQLKRPIELAKSAMPIIDEIAQSAHVIPDMLGMNGPRTYLLIACTEAETRSVGGFPGSAGLLTMDNGKMTISDMEAPALPAFDEGQMVPVTEEEQSIFGNRVGRYFYDVGYIPDFPRAAELMKQIWEAHGKPAIDGIVSVDPVFLQNILGLTGSITTSDGTVVDGTNAAQMLMNTVYITYTSGEAGESGLSNEMQDAFFGEVASQALNNIFNNIGSVDLVEFAKMLKTSIDDKRFYSWMVREDEQAVLERLEAACALSSSETTPELGVYFGVAMGAKIGWYLDVDVQVGNGTSNWDGSISYPVTIVFRNNLSEEAAQTLPDIISGKGYVPIKRTASDMLLDFYVFAPAGGTITDVQTSGYFVPSNEFGGGWFTRPGEEPLTQTSYNGCEVYYGVTAIDGLDSTTVTCTVTTSSKAEESLGVDMTPLAQG